MTVWRLGLFRRASPDRLRFDDFELRLSPPALFRSGRRIKIRRQPIKLLILLASSRNVLVDHESIRALLWPGQTVDFAGGTHVCIRQIRDALSDDGASPRMIENVPGQGYRFLPRVVAESSPSAGEIRLPIPRLAALGLTAAAVAALIVLLSPAANDRASLSPAFDAYARGQYLLEQDDPPAARRALRLFRQATDADPQHAPSYLGAAEANLKLDAYPEAARLAQAALRRDPSLAAAHVVLGEVALRQTWQWDEAARHFTAALAADEKLASAHQGAAVAAILSGRRETALRHMSRARRLDPASTLVRADYGWMEFVAGRPGRAAELCGEALELTPASLDARICLARALAASGRKGEALAHALAMMSSAGASAGEIASVAAARNEPMVAFERWRLRRYEHPQRKEPVSPALLAGIHAYVGNREAALDLLERSVAEHLPIAPLVALDPSFRPLADEPRYRHLAATMNIILLEG